MKSYYKICLRANISREGGEHKMAIDMELISSEKFNLKFKNRLRDFYIYQFKNSETDFYDKGSLLDARILAGCILMSKYNVSKDELCAIQMQDIQIDSDIDMTNMINNIRDARYLDSSVKKVSKTKSKKDEICILIKNQSDDINVTSVLYSNILRLTINSSSKTVQFQKDVVEVGQDKTCDLLLEGKPAIACHQATFLYENNMWFLCDNLSTNGTWLNGCKIEPGKKYQLEANDEIDFAMSEKIIFDSPRKILIQKPFSQMVSLLYSRNMTELFLTGNTRKPISENIISKLHNVLTEYESLNEADDYEIFDKWKQLYLSAVNNAVKYGTFRNDSIRLHSIIEPLAGVEWKYGDVLDKGKIILDKVNKHVECITVDGRSITNNPFQELYKFCDENSTYSGQLFLLTYFLVLHFHIGGFLERYDNIPLKKSELNALNFHHSEKAVKLESESRGGRGKTWEKLSEKDKHLFGNMAIEKVHLDCAKDCTSNRKNKTVEKTQRRLEINDIYNRILVNNKQVVLVGDRFIIEDKMPFQVSFIEKNILYELYGKYATTKKLEEKQFRNNLNKLTQLGILICKKQGERLFYSLSNEFLYNIWNNDNDFRVRFAEMVSFFSQVIPLGEIGSYILNRITNKPNTNIRFKHNYLKRALNDFNLIDLLNAIEQKKWIEIEYRNASVVDLKYQKFVCFPLEIRESVNDGRQFLLFYHPGFRSVSAVRLEFIDSIKVGTINEMPFFAEDIKRAEKLVAYTWGTAFDNFKKGNVKNRIEINQVRVVVKCDKTEFYIKNRVQRECRGFIDINPIVDEKHGTCLELIAELTNFKEFLRWVRSLMCRVVSVEVNGSEYIRFYDDVINMARRNKLTEIDRLCDNEQFANEKEIMLEFKSGFKETDSIHELLFNELFSEPFHKVGCVLFDLLNQDDVDKAEIFKNYSEHLDPAVATDRKKQLEVVIDAFIASKKRKKSETFWAEYEDVSVPKLSFKPNFKFDSMWDLIPLTNVEIQWIQNVICHPLAKCFLTSNELKRIKYSLPNPNLFNINRTVLYDQFSDMEGFYAEFKNGAVVRTILQAIREKRTLTIQYQDQYKEPSSPICYPSHIEYSKRDNKFRLRGISDNKVKTFNIERIQNISITDNHFDHDSILEKIKDYDTAQSRSIKVSFGELKNIPDRILTEFSCFKKNCLKIANDRYRMTLFYSEDDAKEILIRLLSYGPYIDIDEDGGTVKSEYLERIIQQLDLVKTREIVKEQIKRNIEEQR